MITGIGWWEKSFQAPESFVGFCGARRVRTCDGTGWWKKTVRASKSFCPCPFSVHQPSALFFPLPSSPNSYVGHRKKISGLHAMNAAWHGKITWIPWAMNPFSCLSSAFPSSLSHHKITAPQNTNRPRHGVQMSHETSGIQQSWTFPILQRGDGIEKVVYNPARPHS